ncbi:GNAT family N-acetyltransferase [Lapillicoccus sp.]|uniref:GNAT family N-acetyltransferase n=1 Tax=Lapillicoccus sp. TaxID=1909287 RepID=UPI0025F9FF0B|nr:GNAT family N-acetyltransferase [Lapillicoccus sp.]
MPPETSLPHQTRPLTPEDAAQSHALGAEAFGPYPAGQTAPAPGTSAGKHDWGTFVGGRLAARMATRSYGSWWHGVEVPTSGIASVAVSPEARGGGLLTELFRAALAEARERGETLSTLYPTAPGIYRKFGYELVGSYDLVTVPTLSLRGLAASPEIALRRAEVADMPAVRAVYDAWASRQHGPLTRRGESFTETDEEVLREFTGVTLATDPSGSVVGYASWERGPGYDSASWIRVLDLLAVDPRAYPALWRFFGGFASVTGEIRFRTSGAVGTDEARLHLTTDVGRVVDSRPYMLRVDDVAAAFTVAVADGRFADVRREFAVVGDLLGVQDGSYRLEGDGCVRTGAAPEGGDLPTFAPRGLALSYAGVQSAANLRQLGLLHGPADHDAVFDGWSGGAPVHVRDYF